jgi:hypothetical protein
MQRNAVAFGIDNHCTKTVRPELMFVLQNFSAVCADRFDRIIEPAFDRQINQRTVLRRFVFAAGAVTADTKTARRVLFLMRQKSVFESALGHLWHFPAEHGGIKLNRAIKIRNRDIGPAEGIYGAHTTSLRLSPDPAKPGSVLDFFTMPLPIVFVRLAVFLIGHGLVRTVAEWLVLGKTAHTNPDRFFLRFDFERLLVRLYNSAHARR